MAVIEDLGLSVTIQVDGMPLEEYDDPEPDQDNADDETAPPACHKYVEAKDGAEYEVHFKALPGNPWVSARAGRAHVLQLDVYVDGEVRRVKHLSWADQVKYGGLLVEGATEHSGHRRTLRRFKFSTLSTVEVADERTVRGDLQRAKELGLIRLVVFRGRHKGSRDAHPRQSHGDPNLTVAEKALKGRAISHGTSFSPAIVLKGTRFAHVKRVTERPFAIFNFKYRSRDALRSEMIVPRTPSPSPVDGLEGLSQDDIRRLARERLAEVKEERVKSEPSGVKRELSEVLDLTEARPRAVRRKRSEVEAIDLTDD